MKCEVRKVRGVTAASPIHSPPIRSTSPHPPSTRLVLYRTPPLPAPSSSSPRPIHTISPSDPRRCPLTSDGLLQCLLHRAACPVSTSACLLPLPPAPSPPPPPAPFPPPRPCHLHRHQCPLHRRLPLHPAHCSRRHDACCSLFAPHPSVLNPHSSLPAPHFRPSSLTPHSSPLTLPSPINPSTVNPHPSPEPAPP